MQNDKEIKALIQLLDDDDKEVLDHVYGKLIGIGPEVIPALEQVWQSDENPLLQDRLEEIIHTIQFDSLVKETETWVASETQELLTGAFIVSKFYYPDLLIEDVQRAVFKIKQRIWLELNYNQTALEQVQIFNQLFYNIHRFTNVPGSMEYNEFCINHVMETKKGNAISLGILYQIIANDLNLPVYGVTLIRHYILCFCKRTLGSLSTEERPEREIMFYINPVNRGSIFSRNEIKEYLDKLNAPHDTQFYAPATNISIISEMMSNLIDIHIHLGMEEKANDLKRLKALLQPNH